MIQMCKRMCCVVLCGVLAVSAWADAEEPGLLGLGVQAGTLGVGPVVTVTPASWFTLRGDFGWLKFDQDVSSGGTDYVVAFDYASGGLLADLYPFGGPIRLTGGARFGSNAFGVEAEVADGWEIGGVSYPVEALESVSGTVVFDDDVAPYVGIGIGNPARAQRWIAMLDVGVVFQSATVTLDAVGAAADTEAFQSNLAQEEADLQEELDAYELYPVVTLILGYKF